MKKILITGGSGFVGKNTCEYFKQNENYEVHAPNMKPQSGNIWEKINSISFSILQYMEMALIRQKTEVKFCNIT